MYNELFERLVFFFELINRNLLLFDEINCLLSEQLLIVFKISELLLLFEQFLLLLLQFFLVDELVSQHFLFSLNIQ
jgi:hypothetical protein